MPYLKTYAPPALTFLHLKHFHTPVACLLTLSVYLIEPFHEIITLNTVSIVYVGSCNDYLRVLAAERAVIFWVLCHFHLLDNFTKSSAVSGSILSANANLLRVISLWWSFLSMVDKIHCSFIEIYNFQDNWEVRYIFGLSLTILNRCIENTQSVKCALIGSVSSSIQSYRCNSQGDGRNDGPQSQPEKK